MNKNTIWWILFAYSIISVISALTSGSAGAVNLAATSGVMIAMIFYTRRYMPEKREFVSKIFIAATVVATVISIILAIVLSKGGIIGNIISNVGSGICTLVLILLANGKKFEFMELCDTKKFIIVLLVCLLVLPSIMLLVSGVVSFVLAMLLIVVFAAAMFSNLGGFMMSQQTTKTIFRDERGFEHATALDRDKTNEEIRAEKE